VVFRRAAETQDVGLRRNPLLSRRRISYLAAPLKKELRVKKKPANTTIEIDRIEMGRINVHILGTTPLIVHRYAAKAWHELLFPGEEKNKAALAVTLKHDPLEEFRQCCYLNRDRNEPTLLHYPAGAFSKAIASAALDIPGAKKAQILRLVSIASTQVNLYGVPQLGMDMVRSSNEQRSPDVRTRAYLPEWTCDLEIEFATSLLGAKQIVNLLAAAGVIVGLGDYRPQKGGQYGKFMTVAPDDPAVLRIRKQARAAQEAALASPSFFSDDAAELFQWFNEEVKRREKIAASSLTDGMPEPQPKTLVAAKAKRNGRGAQA
jgi:hypothetical protein